VIERKAAQALHIEERKMDGIKTFLASLISSGALGIGAARWMVKHLVDHRLKKDLKDHQAKLDEKLATTKAEFDNDLATTKAELEAKLRLQVDEILGEKAAERQYRLEARKHLYTAIGPLRFQLLAACSDFVNRISSIGSGVQRYSTTLKGYFGQSTTFRLLRLIAISELIERQVAHADFSVEPSTAALLRFKQAAFDCLSSSLVSLNHPETNWNDQVEHLYRDSISIVASTVIVHRHVDVQRIMTFDEFHRAIVKESFDDDLLPLIRIMEGFSVSERPIFWFRLLALAQLCHGFAANEANKVGLRIEAFDGRKLISTTCDPFIKSNLESYAAVLTRLETLCDAP
jgi:hypothetical protein